MILHTLLDMGSANIQSTRREAGIDLWQINCNIIPGDRLLTTLCFHTLNKNISKLCKQNGQGARVWTNLVSYPYYVAPEIV